MVKPSWVSRKKGPTPAIRQVETHALLDAPGIWQKRRACRAGGLEIGIKFEKKAFHIPAVCAGQGVASAKCTRAIGLEN